MVRIKKRGSSSHRYYYLEHSYREGGKVKKKELYLGQTIPENVDELKNHFLHGIYAERWFKTFNEIKKLFIAEERELPKSIREKNLENFMINFTYSTNRIEGSKLSFKDTANLLEKGITPRAKPVSDIKEAENHRKAFYNMLGQKKDLTLELILFWHKMIFNDTKSDIAGRLREYRVMILGSKHMPPSPEAVLPMISDLLRWYNENKRIMHSVELAAIFHLRFESIHPFGDGNGRIGRLLMNFILHRKGFPMLNIPYSNRGSYYTALERSQIKHNDYIFVMWFFKNYLKENKRFQKKSV